MWSWCQSVEDGFPNVAGGSECGRRCPHRRSLLKSRGRPSGVGGRTTASHFLRPPTFEAVSHIQKVGGGVLTGAL
jgi:hypothetical protein